MTPDRASRNLIAKLRDVARVEKLVSVRDMDAIGQRIVSLMKQDAARGLSPITGRAYPRYKRPERYPGARKPARPVNLRLTGAFLRSLRHDFQRADSRGVMALRVYFASQLSVLKELGHRNGQNGQPRRPFLPFGKQQLREGIRKEIRLMLRQIIDRKKKS